jgi:protease-4
MDDKNVPEPLNALSSQEDPASRLDQEAVNAHGARAAASNVDVSAGPATSGEAPRAPLGQERGADRGAAASSLGALTERGALDAVLLRVAEHYLDDRRRERRWRLFSRVGWLLILFAVFWVLRAEFGLQAAPSSAPHTALIDVRGEIAEGTPASADLLLPALRSAFQDEGSMAVVLRFNSPGGSPVQAGIVNDEIRRLKALHNKPVYAVVEEVCASGAYYIAVAADEIFVDKASVVGSIGVLMDGFGFTGLMQKAGVERRLYTAGESKGINDPFSPETPAHRAHTQSLLNQIHQQFMRAVSEGRGERLKAADSVFSGLYWSGEQSLKLGLADRLGSLDFVAREVVRAEDIVDYTPSENVAERLAKELGASVGTFLGRHFGHGVAAGLRDAATPESMPVRPQMR